MMIKNVLKVSAIVLVLGMASGCASQEAIDEAARAAADSAAQAAAGAQSTADRALATAGEAQTCCDANRDRLERMFQKSMSK
jgi:hypothetical protein